MKPILIILTLISIASADYLNTKTSNQCVYNVRPYQDHTGWCYTKRSNDHDYCNRHLKMKDLIDGYYLNDDGDCVEKNDLRTTGLTQNEWDYNLSLLAHVMGFTMLFLINFLSVLVVRK